MGFLNMGKDHAETEYTHKPNSRLFEVGKLYPPTADIPRLAKYSRGRKLYDGDHRELFNRAQALLGDTPHAERLDHLYLAVNLVDILVHKPSDLMYGEPPSYESGKAPKSVQQTRLSSIVEENDLNSLGQEIVVGAGYRGDSFLKTYFSYRHDYSELPFVPKGVQMESIVEAQDPSTVFVELARGSKKKFKAVNIAYMEWVTYPNGKEIPYLNVERHLAGYIQYQRFELSIEGSVNNEHGVPITQYEIIREVETGRKFDLVETGVPYILVHHIPFKSTDDRWQGISGVEKVEGLIGAVNDRLAQIDYILLKHSDPTVYGAALNGSENLSWGGRYIPVEKNDVSPAYMTWDGKLEGAFKQLELLINLVFQMAETPQWLYGTTIGNAGGTGTSHTDGAAIKARFMPILSKVKRTRTHVDKAMRDALYAAQLIENFANEENTDFTQYEAVYPKIRWRDGVPTNAKEMAEVMNIRTGGRPTLDQRTAIKEADGLDDVQVEEVMRRIEKDAEQDQLASPSIFNEGEEPQIDDPQQQEDAVNNE